VNTIMSKFLRTVGFAALLLALAGCSRGEPQPEVLRGNVFGTFFEVSIGAQHDIDQAYIESGVLEALEMVDQQMSTYREDSDLNRINQAPLGEPVQVPAELFYVLQVGYNVAEQSEGAFDYTVGALVNLWGFGPEGRVETAPSEELLKQRLAEVGFRYIELDEANQTVTRHADVFVDLSGIAKGYGVDVVSDYLLSQGIDNHLVNIGGDLIAKGRRSEERSWRIGIEAPNDQDQIIQQVIELHDTAMLGSGDYRNYFEEDGVRYSHTIDPTTGYPISHRLAGVNVLGADATTADALATVLMVLGEERGLEFANAHNVAAFFIYRTGEGFGSVMSERFKREFESVMSVPQVQ